MISWELAQNFFVWEGSFPEIVMCGSDSDAWTSVLASLPKSKWGFRYSWNGIPMILPKTWEESEALNGSPLLEIEPDRLKLQSHFHQADLVNFTLDPRDFGDEKKFGELLEFMSWMTKVTAAPIMFSSPGELKYELFRVEYSKNG